MNQPGPSARRRRFANTGQRIFALLVFAVLGYLIWLAYSGQYDAQVNRVAAWLHRHYESLRALLR